MEADMTLTVAVVRLGAWTAVKRFGGNQVTSSSSPASTALPVPA